MKEAAGIFSGCLTLIVMLSIMAILTAVFIKFVALPLWGWVF
jgi:hypothetical protein